MESTTITATGWTHLAEVLFEGSWNPSLRRHRSPFVYRGASRAGQLLHASLSRLGGDYAAKEPHVLRNFRKYALRSFVGDDSIWNWLALAQHHGLPTRLLDWTFSPFVALHFATAELDDFRLDGEVWMVDFERTNRELPEPLQRALRETHARVFTGEILSSVVDTPGALEALAPEPFVLFLEPPSLDDRIVNQLALFSMMSSARAGLHEWLERRPEACRRIVIPADVKWEVRDKLDQANVTERVLFPGLDGLSRWLRRYYTERP